MDDTKTALRVAQFVAVASVAMGAYAFAQVVKKRSEQAR